MNIVLRQNFCGNPCQAKLVVFAVLEHYKFYFKNYLNKVFFEEIVSTFNSNC